MIMAEREKSVQEQFGRDDVIPAGAGHGIGPKEIHL